MLIQIDNPTPEGLVVHEKQQADGSSLIEEVGKLDFVIYEYRVIDPDGLESCIARPLASFILERLVYIEDRCREHASENPPTIEGLAWRWNRKRAKKRFRRWMQENNQPDLVLPDPRLRIAALEALDADDAAEQQEVDILEHLAEGGEGWGILQDYLETKIRMPPLIIGEQIPEPLRAVLREAREAHLYGLSRATIALCRATLEELLWTVVKAQKIDLHVIDLYKEGRIPRLIEALPETILNRSRKDWAREIVNRGNAVLHESTSTADPWETLTHTVWIVEYVINRGGLRAATKQ